jgi:hypothetical protein
MSALRISAGTFAASQSVLNDRRFKETMHRAPGKFCFIAAALLQTRIGLAGEAPHADTYSSSLAATPPGNPAKG